MWRRGVSEAETPRIQQLIDTPDMVEVVRDQIAAVLSLELQNQYVLANERSLSYAKEYNIPVYVENGRPYEASGDKRLLRFVNVLLPKVIVPVTNARVGGQKEQAFFFIDCVACGNDTGTFRDDKSECFRVWKITRIVRRILMATEYAYLGLRGVVGSRIITSIEDGTPEKSDIDRESAIFYVVVRITLEVQFIERYIDTDGGLMEPVRFEVEPYSGEILTNMK
jgi:hypothetical protein